VGLRMGATRKPFPESLANRTRRGHAGIDAIDPEADKLREQLPAAWRWICSRVNDSPDFLRAAAKCHDDLRSRPFLCWASAGFKVYRAARVGILNRQLRGFSIAFAERTLRAGNHGKKGKPRWAMNGECLGTA
jgi:hypothetical protein